jgi:hypothetical protein
MVPIWNAVGAYGLILPNITNNWLARSFVEHLKSQETSRVTTEGFQNERPSDPTRLKAGFLVLNIELHIAWLTTFLLFAPKDLDRDSLPSKNQKDRNALPCWKKSDQHLLSIGPDHVKIQPRPSILSPCQLLFDFEGRSRARYWNRLHLLQTILPSHDNSLQTEQSAFDRPSPSHSLHVSSTSTHQSASESYPSIHELLTPPVAECKVADQTFSGPHFFCPKAQKSLSSSCLQMNV